MKPKTFWPDGGLIWTELVLTSFAAVLSAGITYLQHKAWSGFIPLCFLLGIIFLLLAIFSHRIVLSEQFIEGPSAWIFLRARIPFARMMLRRVNAEMIQPSNGFGSLPVVVSRTEISDHQTGSVIRLRSFFFSLAALDRLQAEIGRRSPHSDS